MTAAVRTIPSDQPAYQMMQAYRLLRHASDDALRDLELTTPQFAALACLGRGDGLSGAEMARIHHMTPQTMHTILLNLEHAGLVVREPHPQHGTLLRVCLTDAGRSRLEDARRRLSEVQSEMLRGLTHDERRALAYLLGRCIRALEESAGPEPPGDDCSE